MLQQHQLLACALTAKLTSDHCVMLLPAGGLACLCGQQGRWVLRRSAASLGRSTDVKGDVDIDLGQAAGDAGVGTKVSRLQAQLLLTADGSWSIHNTGRAPLAVNGTQVGDCTVVNACRFTLAPFHMSSLTAVWIFLQSYRSYSLCGEGCTQGGKPH